MILIKLLAFRTLPSATVGQYFTLVRSLTCGVTRLSKKAEQLENDEPVAEDLPVTFVDDDAESEEAREARIATLRNKSRLLPQHRNMLHGVLPYEQSQSWIHETVKYKRMMLGRYGIDGSRVDPRVCFPTKQEAYEKAEYERVAYPFTLKQMMDANEMARKTRKAAIEAREAEVARKLEKLDQWTTDLNARIAKKEAEARAAKERKDRLVEEVRRHFGFKVDPRDERFQEMLALKEREDRKKVKEAKRKEKEEKMMEKLQKKTAQFETDETSEQTKQ
ncbi:growth arrest and DNA damage-inducible proteins-interacting protein 1 [Anopheles maculipalpis]|uniref:growth arrest and DNA damage-inducible proteins-interacting protein 1 n=1 Tax=Anopheles maculipalpis TaxID=1496333 RepID=UPI002158F4A6|nr:growth arrest and DNA damage-inducible proteins-interacting protein 1 [Anopheles maculipalpis]